MWPVIIAVTCGVLFLAAATVAGLLYLRWEFADKMLKESEKMRAEVVSRPPPSVDLNPLQKTMEAMPNKLLQSIQGSVNVHKGVLGELIGYVQLRAQYDRIIPLGNIVDFICIKFPKDDQEGCVDFVDVKTGNKKRLSTDQRALQKLIDDKKINFIKMKVETSANQPTRS